MYRRKQQISAVFMAAKIKRQATSETVLTGFGLYKTFPRLTEEEFAEFEKALDR